MVMNRSNREEGGFDSPDAPRGESSRGKRITFDAKAKSPGGHFRYLTMPLWGYMLVAVISALVIFTLFWALATRGTQPTVQDSCAKNCTDQAQLSDLKASKIKSDADRDAELQILRRMQLGKP
jgi:hypothetical protein